MTAPPLLAVRGLVKDYAVPGVVPWRRRYRRVLHGIDFDLAAGETLGLVGESGSGKSTIGRAILGLAPATAGSIRLDGAELVGLSRRAMRPARRAMQMVWQDPGASLNPLMSIGETLDETILANHPAMPSADRAARAGALMERVGLPAEMLALIPGPFSGGQLQRVAIARALAVQPRLIIADEPVSALDTSVQAQVLNLLRDVQREQRLSLLFIAHDLAVVRQMSARIAVLYRGHMVEIGPSAEIVRAPAHPYTRSLLAAVPGTRRNAARTAAPLAEAAAWSGCAYAGSCPMAVARCRAEAPELRDLAPGRRAACHLA